MKEITEHQAFIDIEACYKTGKIKYGLAWEKAYLYAEKSGLITLTNEEKNTFKDMIISDLKYKSRVGNTMAKFLLVDNKRVVRHCREELLKKYFEAKFPNPDGQI